MTTPLTRAQIETIEKRRVGYASDPDIRTLIAHAVTQCAEIERLQGERVHVYKDKTAAQWHDEAMANLKGWHEEGDRLKQQLAEATCGEALCGHDHSNQYWELRANKAEQQLATVTQERDSLAGTVAHVKWELENQRTRADANITLRIQLEQQLITAQARLTALEGALQLSPHFPLCGVNLNLLDSGSRTCSCHKQALAQGTDPSASAPVQAQPEA